MNSAKPVNLFVIGAMKAGTTAFIDLLSKHPEIHVPPVKEPNYFVSELPKRLYEPSRFFNLEHYLEHEFPEPLHNTRIESAEQYERIYGMVSGERYLVDGSITYLHAPGVPERIHAYNPDAAIVVLVRDPLKRAYSHYAMDVSLGNERRTFEAAINEEIRMWESDALPWNSYMGMSMYNKRIKLYRSLFERVVIIRFEEVVTDPDVVLKKLAEVLDIIDFETFHLEKKNSTRSLRFPKLFYILKQMGLKDFFSRFLSSSFKQKILDRVSTTEKQPMQLSGETRAKLEAIFNSESRGW